MKPYFAKWIPVEGEIKEGDWFLWKDEGTDSPHLFRCVGLTGEDHLQVKWSKETGCYWRDTLNESGYGDWNKAFAKKVKLFLCSNDIQVGDKFRLISNQSKEFEASKVEIGSGESYFPKEMLIYHKEDQVQYWFHLNACFKVIGEISPEAIWVKEGDKFDSSEISFMWDTGENSQGWFRIKGPCGHFH